MRRWPKGNVGGVMGAMDRSGLIATLHDWDITNTGDVLDIIRGRLRNEVYLRQLWSQVVFMKHKGRSGAIGNPMREAQMVTGLAVMDYLNEICPRLTYSDVILNVDSSE